VATRTKNQTGPADVDAWLAALPAEQRVALQALRETILSIVPDATELLSYQVPTIRTEGAALVAYAAFPDHLSLLLMSPPAAKTLKDDLAGFRVSGATVHFQPDTPLPGALIRRVVEVRLAENRARRKRSCRGRPSTRV
jgi:uncharacterized protein YdhG (YjbR/CyaY superfamily)